MLESFLFHTLRAAQYPDAYWQWIKVSQCWLEDILPEHKQLYRAFKEVYTYGWQYDMYIISLEEFREYLDRIAQQLGGEHDRETQPEYSDQLTSKRRHRVA